MNGEKDSLHFRLYDIYKRTGKQKTFKGIQKMFRPQMDVIAMEKFTLVMRTANVC